MKEEEAEWDQIDKLKNEYISLFIADAFHVFQQMAPTAL